MGTFFLLGKYGADAFRDISKDRTEKSRQLVEQLGGKVKAVYALLGEVDLIFIVEFPNMADAMKASIALGKMTGISFSTAAAMTVEEFDNIVGDM